MEVNKNIFSNCSEFEEQLYRAGPIDTRSELERKIDEVLEEDEKDEEQNEDTQKRT